MVSCIVMSLDASQLFPRLSVVVCTRNRLSKLKRCVDALLSTTTPHEWELAIVDNASADGTSEYLASINHVQLNRAHVTTMSEVKCGLSAARNKGWRAAKGVLIAFTDDDCYVSRNYVNSVVKVFDDDLSVGFLSGRVLLFDALDYRITIQECQRRYRFQPWTFIPAGVVQGANLAFRRTVLEQIGGFDERLGAGTPFPSEDIDAAAAALWSGVIGVYDPRPVVQHHHGRRSKGEVQQLVHSYDAGRGAYYAKWILRKASRSKYLKAWSASIKNDCVRAFRRGRIPWQSLRELSSGLRFLFRRSLKPAS